VEANPQSMDAMEHYNFRLSQSKRRVFYLILPQAIFNFNNGGEIIEKPEMQTPGGKYDAS